MARILHPWRDTEVPAPMLATAVEAPAVNLADTGLLFEQKFDGIRAIVVVEPRHPWPLVSLYSRNGNDKATQFPDIVKALRELAGQLNRPVVLDGEIVALDTRGQPASFTALQSRMHLTGTRDIEARAADVPTALIVFDLLREGQEDLRPLPLAARRARLEALLHVRTSERLREGGYVAGDGHRVLARAEREGWEGLIVKHADAPYASGVRSRTWRKVKLQKRATLVIGGWTEPKGTRPVLGALMVGTRHGQAHAVEAQPAAPMTRSPARPRAAHNARAPLCYAGNVGTGFTVPILADLQKRLAPLASSTTPFADPPKMRGLHWVEPRLLCEVRFTEWTPDGHLRHPVFLGLRDDVGIEAVDAPPDPSGASAADTGRHGRADAALHDPALQAIIGTLQQLEDSGRDGTLVLPEGKLDVTNLRKVFWPGAALTKGDLLRFYTRVSPWLLPVLHDRPLVMKRYPNGVTGKSFYQQRAPDAVPTGVRMQVVGDDHEEPMPRLIGGSLLTLLYTAQLGALSQDPWFSRAQSPAVADFAAIDLDPMPGVAFSQVRDVARWVYEVLAALDVPAVAKTSGSSGLHIYIPLGPDTTYQSGQLLCQIVATTVASQHPKVATVERSVGRRGRTVYVDYLQNIEGKTLACAYSARASTFAGVSTPLRWEELDGDARPEDFTMESIGTRLASAGDLWNPVMQGPTVDLRDVIARLERG